MADIAMCSGKDCPHKDNCYRHTAQEGMLQTYFLNPPIDEDGKCDYYWGDNAEIVWSTERINNDTKNKS